MNLTPSSSVPACLLYTSSACSSLQMWIGKLGDATTVKKTDSFAWDNDMKNPQSTINNLQHNVYVLVKN